ncbi:hypothetical protein C8F04DRAFT_1091945 [Mycena alexandri]|uniref:Leucine-rich repeat domain-containing protein n=1 Tax=Mycena alexandri TaxID=1745969 RepID=A0AAD6T5E6_9AGAR|nr:hypothetical protein C8F04DRAFT_1091945 [Mycena alexandri]
MEFTTNLPIELWLAILSSLYLPDLVSVSALSSSFQSLALPALQAQKSLRARYHRLGHDMAYGEPYWYPLLLTLLRNPAAAFYVDDLEVEHTIRDRAHQIEETGSSWTVEPADVALVRQAVEEEHWIPEGEKDAFVERLLDGDEDAMVTVMVLRMPNLRKLSLPTYCWGGLSFEYLMPIVARIAQAAANGSGVNSNAGRPDSTGMDYTDALPLSRLEHYEGQVFNGYYGVDFESIAPLMALPSLRTLSTAWNHEDGFDWPASLPKSNVREIVIDEGTVTRAAIIRLAKGIRGPCAIHQKWGFRRHDDTPEQDWDSLGIPFDGATEADWVVKFDKGW